MDNINRTVNKKVKKKFFTIPYVKSISKKFSPINIFNCKLASIPNSKY